MRRLRILVLMHPDFLPPDSSDGYTPQEINVWKTEYDVVSTLRAAGHEVRPLGAQVELTAAGDHVIEHGIERELVLARPPRDQLPDLGAVAPDQGRSRL